MLIICLTINHKLLALVRIHFFKKHMLLPASSHTIPKVTTRLEHGSPGFNHAHKPLGGTKVSQSLVTHALQLPEANSVSTFSHWKRIPVRSKFISTECPRYWSVQLTGANWCKQYGMDGVGGLGHLEPAVNYIFKQILFSTSSLHKPTLAHNISTLKN